VTTDKCGTEPVWGNAFIVIDTACPCSGVFIFATDFNQVDCADGNWSVNYDALPAGDYWAPEILDPASGNEGKYNFNITAAENVPPAGCGDPESGDCCVPNGSPACDDEACCNEICAGDAFCCDTEWDSICADAAVLTCDVCGGDPGGPPNDDCADRSPLSDGVTPFDTNGATTDGVNPLDPSCEKGFGLDLLFDIWYEYVASCTGTVTISTCDTANYDTRLAAYIGQDCPAEAFAGCNDDGDGCGGFTSIMTFPATAGQSYKIRVGGFGGTGTGDLTVSCN